MIDQYVIFGILLKYIQGIRYIPINFFSISVCFFWCEQVFSVFTSIKE